MDFRVKAPDDIKMEHVTETKSEIKSVLIIWRLESWFFFTTFLDYMVDYDAKELQSFCACQDRHTNPHSNVASNVWYETYELKIIIEKVSRSNARVFYLFWRSILLKSPVRRINRETFFYCYCWPSCSLAGTPVPVSELKTSVFLSYFTFTSVLFSSF